MMCFGQVFYLSMIQADEAFPEQAFSINYFLRNQYTGAEKISICSGSTQIQTLFSLYSQVFTTTGKTPWNLMFEVLSIEAVFPTEMDFSEGIGQIRQIVPASIPIVSTDQENTATAPLYYTVSKSGKKILFANITVLPSNWYERLRKEINFLTYDAIILIMDSPDFRIVPESLRSKTIVIPRKTAVYRVDLEYGMLITEMKLPEEKEIPSDFEVFSEDYDLWLKKAFALDPEGKSYLYEIPFYSMMGIMMKNLYPSDLAMFSHRSLPLFATPSETLLFFKDYVFGTLYLENASIRKLLERSASVLELVNTEAIISSSEDYFSLWGEPYYFDLTKSKGERLIIKTFDKPQKICFFGPKDILEKTVPGIKILPYSPLPYIFWAMKYSEVHLDPSWQTLTQPYFSEYTIRKGDTLTSIAANFGIRIEDIKRYNPELIDMYLQPGTVLKIHVPIGQ
jgi:hypothetical protein